MADSKKPKDPKEYAWALERGYKNIPSRPLFGNTLRDFEKTFRDKIAKAGATIMAEWK